MRIEITTQIRDLEGVRALWLSEQPCLPQPVAGEAFNDEHVQSIVRVCGGELGLPLVAWLSPEPHNPHDPNAVMVWARGGKVGYLPREDAVHWGGIVTGLQQQSRLPVACCAHIELPAETGAEKCYQCVLWLPPLPWQRSQPLSGPDAATYMAKARAEPGVRAARAQAIEEKRQADAARRRADLIAKFGVEAANKVVAGEPWLGATEAMIIATLGEPEKVEEKVLKTKTKRSLCYVEECPKCDGSGFIPEFEHVEDGKCFACNGTGRRKGFSLRVHVENGAVVGWDKK